MDQVVERYQESFVDSVVKMAQWSMEELEATERKWDKMPITDETVELGCVIADAMRLKQGALSHLCSKRFKSSEKYIVFLVANPPSFPRMPEWLSSQISDDTRAWMAREQKRLFDADLVEIIKYGRQGL